MIFSSMLVTLGVAGVGGPIPVIDEENRENDIILGTVGSRNDRLNF